MGKTIFLIAGFVLVLAACGLQDTRSSNSAVAKIESFDEMDCEKMAIVFNSRDFNFSNAMCSRFVINNRWIGSPGYGFDEGDRDAYGINNYMHPIVNGRPIVVTGAEGVRFSLHSVKVAVKGSKSGGSKIEINGYRGKNLIAKRVENVKSVKWTVLSFTNMNDIDRITFNIINDEANLPDNLYVDRIHYTLFH